MKVNVYVFGRFHAFDLAYQLQKNKSLSKLISSYPYFISKSWGIQSKNYRSRFFFEILKRVIFFVRLPYADKIENFFKFLFSVTNNFYTNSANIHISWSSSSLYLFKFLKRNKNQILILERGSSHYSFQSEILQEEYHKNNLTFNVDKIALSNELREYAICDYITVPSNFVKNTFIEKGVKSEKIFVNPYGVDLSSFNKTNHANNKFRIIFVGKACVRKGFQYLIETMKILKEYDIELWHLGNIHPEIKKFDYQQENIVYKGSKPQKELYRYYNQCDVFVLPSLEEGLAMVTLQAMACGLPVICTPNTGIENVITSDGEEGFLIPIRDPIAIKEKVLQLYNNQPLKRKMGEAAHKKVSSGFTWEDYGRRYIEFLNKIQNA